MLTFNSKLVLGLVSLFVWICWVVGSWRSRSQPFQAVILTGSKSVSAPWVYLVLLTKEKKNEISLSEENCAFLVAFRGAI